MGHRQLARRIRQQIRAADPNNHHELFELLDEMKDLMERLLEHPRFPTETTVYHVDGGQGPQNSGSPFSNVEINTSFVLSDVEVFSDADGPASLDSESSESSEYEYKPPASPEIRLYEHVSSDESDVLFVAPYAAII